MAFLEATKKHNNERFTLLGLEPGEIYFQDFAVEYFPFHPEWGEDERVKRKQKGWLKVCSKSVVFDPKDHQYPLLKIPYRDLDAEPSKWTGNLFSKLAGSQHLIELAPTQVVEMKENNIIAPYIFKRGRTSLLFRLTFCTPDDCLPLLCQLCRASSLDVGDQTAMIHAIVLARQNKVEFDKSRIEDLSESLLGEYQGDQISPLVTNPGRILLTSQRLYFQPFNNICPTPVLKIKLCEISRVIKRRFLLKHMGLEIYCRKSSSLHHLYLSLRAENIRDELYQLIITHPRLKLDDLGQENMTLRWQNGLVSNYDYLMYLNSLADRSINDLSQYPVFPWVLCDYSSKELDLDNPFIYRDLSQPIGALNRERLIKLLGRYNEMAEPRFLYGSHYSAPGYMLFFLARIAPEYVLCLQNGRFDQPDRMFNSIEDTWRNCLNSMSDFKELTPEFYDDSGGDFLINRELINFGMRQNGRIVSDVELPPWATSAKDFVCKMRAALESDFVSQNLHHWIDLIFGYKQRDEEAENAYNVFYHLTYEGYIDIESIEDLNERAALETQIMEFGQTPKQLFVKPHPQRHLPSPGIRPTPGATPLAVFREKMRDGERASPGCGSCGKEPRVSGSPGPSGVPGATFWSKLSHNELYSSHSHSLHKKAITDVRWNSAGSSILSVATDGMLKMYSVEDRRQTRSFSISTMPLSSCILMPDDSTVIVSCWDNSIYFYSLEFGKTLHTVYAHDDAVSCLWHCHGNTRILCSASWDSTVKLWRCNSEIRQSVDVDILDELEHDAGVTRVCATGDGKQVVTGTKEGEVCVWDTQTRRLTLRQQAHIGAVNSVLYSPDERRLLSSGEDGCLRVVDVATGTEIFTKTCPSEPCSVLWDGKSVLTGNASGDLSVWDLFQAKVKRSMQGHKGHVSCLSVSPNGLLASGGTDSTVRIWSPSVS